MRPGAARPQLPTFNRGKPATNDLAVTWVRNDALQAQDDKGRDGVRAESRCLEGTGRKGVPVLARDAGGRRSEGQRRSCRSSRTSRPRRSRAARPSSAVCSSRRPAKVDVFVTAHRTGRGQGQQGAGLGDQADRRRADAQGRRVHAHQPLRVPPEEVLAPLADIMGTHAARRKGEHSLTNPTLAKGENLHISRMIFNATGKGRRRVLAYGTAAPAGKSGQPRKSIRLVGAFRTTCR